MAKKAQSKTEAMDELFRRSVEAGQKQRGENHAYAIRMLKTDGKDFTSTYYKYFRMLDTMRFRVFRFLASRYLTDYQLCAICGVPYNGNTPADWRSAA